VLVQVPGYTIGVLDGVRPGVLFLSVVPIGIVGRRHAGTFYDQVIGAVRPGLVISVHWDNFTEPASGDLVPLSGEIAAKFDGLLARLRKDGIRFGITQGYQP
jgi:hypothetical protein